MSKTLCFTGHRPNELFGYGYSAQALKNDTFHRELIVQGYQYTDLVNDIIQILHRIHPLGYTKFITGGAQGADQLAFWAVAFIKDYYPEDGIENIVYVPYIEQWKRWRPKGLFGQNEYFQMLEAATDVVYVSEKSYRGPQDMIRHNHAMVDNSDAVLAIYGKSEDYHDAKGGTAECMRYAEKLGKPIIILNPFTHEVTTRGNL